MSLIRGVSNGVKRLFITGANGFVGANLVRHYCDSYETHAVIHDPKKIWRLEEVADRIKIHTVDLAVPATVQSLIEKIRPEIILHFASHPALANEEDELAIFANTVYPLVNLANAVAKTDSCELIVNAGSSSEYGYQKEPMREDMAPNPTSIHGIAKLAQTLAATHAARSKGLPIVTLRLFSVYGPFEHGRRLIPRLILAALAGREIALSDPETSRDFIHLEDVLRAVDKCLDGKFRSGEIFNLGTGTQHTIAKAVEFIREIHGKPLPVKWGAKPANLWDSPTWVADPTLMATEFRFVPTVTFKEGLRNTYEWFRDNYQKYQEYRA